MVRLRTHASWPQAAAFLLIACVATTLSAAVSAPGDGVDFLIEETLSVPTGRGVSLAVMPAEDAWLALEYGPSGGRLLRHKPPQFVSAGQSARFRIDDLAPDGQYDYRLLVAAADAPGPLRARATRTFRTLRTPGATFSFAYATDSHLYETWAWATFVGTQIYAKGLQHFGNLMHALAQDDLDFLVIGGDFAQTLCGNCPGGSDDGLTYAAGTATTIPDALARYARIFGPDLYGRVTHSLPVLTVIGNHDGEAGFQGNPAVEASSLAARLATLPNPYPAYAGNPEGSYYSFKTGDALIVVIDVMRYTTVKPQSADDWTLGAVQLPWLADVLAASDRTWTFVFAEHLDGGEPTPILLGSNYYYGRGGLRATLDDLPSGTFKGEQAVLQALLEQHLASGRAPGGATFFLSGHDHVAIGPREKPRPDGSGTRSFYLTGGRTGYVGPSWSLDPSFKTESDWDLDGTADYETDTEGSRKPGFFRITVRGRQSVTFDYVRSHLTDPELDGTVLYSKTITAER